MGRTEDRHAEAERRIREGEARIARLIPVVERLEKTGNERTAAEARRALVNFETALYVWRDLLRVERARSAGGQEVVRHVGATAPPGRR